MRQSVLFLGILLSISLYHTSAFAITQPSPILTPTPSVTVEYALPYPGILPDHPLYPLKVLRDRILVLFTRDPIRKIQLNLLLSDKRLVMGQLLWEKAKWDLSITTFSEGEKFLLAAALDLMALKKQNMLPPGLADKIELAAKKHGEVINKLISTSSDEVWKQHLSRVLGITNQAIQQIASVK